MDIRVYWKNWRIWWPRYSDHLIETLDVARHTCWMKKVENISFLQARNAGILTTTQKEIAVESYLFCHLRSNIKVRFEMSGDNFQLTSNKWQPWRIHGADVQMVLPNVKWGTAADYHNNLSEFIKCLGTMGDETVWNILYMDHLGKTTPKTVSDKQNHSHSETRQGLSHGVTVLDIHKSSFGTTISKCIWRTTAALGEYRRMAYLKSSLASPSLINNYINNLPMSRISKVLFRGTWGDNE